MGTDTVTRLASQRQTYESDFWAIAQMLGQAGSIESGPFTLSRDDAFWVVTGGGERHCHLLREYAIHHLLYCCYTQAAG